MRLRNKIEESSRKVAEYKCITLNQNKFIAILENKSFSKRKRMEKEQIEHHRLSIIELGIDGRHDGV